MGSSQSARKLTITNEEEEVSIIKVSDTIVERLANAGKKKNAEGAKEVRAPPRAQPPTPKVAPTPTPFPSPSESGAAQAGYPVYYCTDLTLSALEMQHQKEQEIQELDQYWQNRLEKVEKVHSDVSRILDEEYQKAAKEYKTGKKVVNIHQMERPCRETSDKILKCYQDHPKEILKCSSIVEEFSKCVDQRRAQVIATRC